MTTIGAPPCCADLRGVVRCGRCRKFSCARCRRRVEWRDEWPVLMVGRAGSLCAPCAITSRPERVNLPPSEYHESCLLEVFELGDGPIDSGPRHAVWLHRLEAGGYCWECSCGAREDHHALDAALLAEARGHFDQRWEPAAVPIGHFAAIWNDRAAGRPAPSAADLAQLAGELTGVVTPLPRPVEVEHLCGICGKTFQISEDDPHWSTGRGPICPEESKQP